MASLSGVAGVQGSIFGNVWPSCVERSETHKLCTDEEQGWKSQASVHIWPFPSCILGKRLMCNESEVMENSHAVNPDLCRAPHVFIRCLQGQSRAYLWMQSFHKTPIYQVACQIHEATVYGGQLLQGHLEDNARLE